MEKEIETKSKIAEIELLYKPFVKGSERQKITKSGDAEAIFREIWSSSIEIREEFYVLLLNRANKVLGWHKLSQGGIVGTVVDPTLLFAIAIKGLACGIIVAHNHPSGTLQPSESDIQLTAKLKDMAKLFGMAVCDHLILTAEGYYSFADEGL